MAHKKAGGSTRNGRDSNPKYLGVKKFGGQHVIPGNIIIRQRGSQCHAGVGVGMGKDHTLYALIEGRVAFKITGPFKRKCVFVDTSAQLAEAE